MFKLSLDGRRVLDATRHLYDQAFALFGLAWFHRLTGSAEALALADRTLAFLDARMRDPQAGGYLNAWIEGQAGMPLPRRQNPHMHLVEALLILAETSGRADHLDRARALVELFFARFRTGPHGFVTEYFTADWRPAPGADGARHEPGHHFEWIWILLRYARLAGDRTLPGRLADLLEASLARGIDRAPGMLAATFDEIDPQGAPLVTSKRLWPQTETVKALLAAHEAFGDARHLQAAQATIRMIFRHYLRAAGRRCSASTSTAPGAQRGRLRSGELALPPVPVPGRVSAGARRLPAGSQATMTRGFRRRARRRPRPPA
ncbi:MAG: AGE family epimerase/isomerase [Xanthobacteraceae bacterium]|nr:AGE family epimerase/isomerase [Xanthobacteraceae bacterium]